MSELEAYARRFWNWLRYFPYEVSYGLANLARWLPIIWRDRDWDWAYLATIMEAKLRFMAATTDKWHVMGADRSRVEMLECAALLKRLREDDYFDKNLPLGQTFEDCDRGRWWVKHTSGLAKQDLSRLTTVMEKKMRGWWD